MSLQRNALLFFSVLLCSTIHSQITIGNANINEYNLRPSQMLNLTVMNSGIGGTVSVSAVLVNSTGAKLLEIKSQVIQVKQGLNIIANPSLVSVQYENSGQGNYLKNFGRIPSGIFSLCIRVIPVAGIEEGDEYCQEINSTENEFLDLVFPSDLDTIDTKLPLLSWTHSESFNLLTGGDYYELILTEKKKDQSAENAVQTNVPIFSKSYLQTHQVPYSFDAKELKEGQTYAWYVRKISNGMTINRTESWEFTLKKNIVPVPHKYVELKTQQDGSFYSIIDDFVYFRLDENYQAGGISIQLKTEGGEIITPKVKNEQKSEDQITTNGYNTYELDLSTYSLKKGFYLLEVTGAKGKRYVLKLYEE